MSKEKKRALADYLEIGPFEIKEEPGYNDSYPTDYITPKGTYWVLDEQESRQAVYDDIKNLIYDPGLYGAFTPDFINWIENNAIDQEVFKDWLYEDYLDWADDLQYENDPEYGNRLNAECIDLGIITEDEIVDGEYTGDKDIFTEYAETMLNLIESDGETFSEHLRNRFDDEVFQGILKENDAYDLDAIVDEAISWDDFGHFIASWDGKTIELEDGLYAYKQDE